MILQLKILKTAVILCGIARRHTYMPIPYFKDNPILSCYQIEVTQLKEFGIEIHEKAKRMIPVKQQQEH